MVIDHCSYDFITISSLNRNSDILTAILTFYQGCQKWPLLTPKKANKRAQKKRHSPNPCWHGLFAKNRVQIGQIWLLWPHLYFTPAYRGSPPCTLFQHPDNREIGYSNVLNIYRPVRGALGPQMFSNRERERFYFEFTATHTRWLMWLLGLVRLQPAAFISISDRP